MPVYKSGLSHETLKAIADANAIGKISKGFCRANKDKWQGVLSYQMPDAGAPTGSRQVRITHTFTHTRVTGRGATSKARADKLLAAWRQQVQEDARMVGGIAADPTCTVRECITQHINHKESIGKARPSTITYYRNAAKRIFCYPFSSMPLQDLTQAMVQAWVDDMSKRYAGKTVKSSYDLLEAVCRKMLPPNDNPCGEIELPSIKRNSKKQSSRPNALSYDGVARCNSLMDERESKHHGTDYVMLGARIALNTGMRAEEVTGLRWRDVDLLSRTIHVRNVIQRAEIPERDENGEVVYDHEGNPKSVTYSEFDADPKTENSARDIPITKELADLLASHKAYTSNLIKELFPKAKDRPSIGSLYVLGGLDGRHMSPHRLGINWGKFSRSRKIIGTERRPVTFHDLRHTFATRAIANGIDVATVSRILGHSEISVTLNKYVNSDEATQRAAMEKMAEVLSMREQPAAEGVTPFRTGTEW